MIVRPTVSHDAINELYTQDEVFWLRPQSQMQHRSNVRRPDWFLKMTAGLSLGALLTFGSAGAAIGPAAAHAAPAQDPAGAIEAELPQIRPVTAAPIAIPASVSSSSIPADAVAGLHLDGTADLHDDIVHRPERDPQEILQFGSMRVPRWIVETIVRAAEVTGVDAVYMMALADKESSFLPSNKASTSSAEGLFQFISSTWLQVIRDFGPRHGLAEEAAAVQTVNGQLTISNDETRERVLGLRRDAYLSALMAAEMMKRDRAHIERRIGRSMTRSEFYLAHFLGVDSAGRFMELVDEKPKQSAPRVFPSAAKANKTLFFAKRGRKTRHLTVAEVYARLDQMIDARLDRYEGVTNVATADASL